MASSDQKLTGIVKTRTQLQGQLQPSAPKQLQGVVAKKTLQATLRSPPPTRLTGVLPKKSLVGQLKKV